jgi:hypothetical protein
VQENLAGEITLERADVIRAVEQALNQFLDMPGAEKARIRTVIAQGLVEMPSRVDTVIVARHTGQQDSIIATVGHTNCKRRLSISFWLKPGRRVSMCQANRNFWPSPLMSLSRCFMPPARLRPLTQRSPSSSSIPVVARAGRDRHHQTLPVPGTHPLG